MFGGSRSGELNSLAGEAAERGGLNKSARTAFAEPIGRTRGEQDLPWGSLSVAPARHRCRKIPDFRSAFVCVKGAV